MKKIQTLIIITAIAAVMALSISACSPASQEESSSAVNSENIVSEENEDSSGIESSAPETDSLPDNSEDSDDPDDDMDDDMDEEDFPSSDDNGEALPPVEGSESFKKAFADNAIDADYLNQYNISGSVVEMVKINNGAADNWKKVIVAANKDLVKMDPSAEAEQQEWKDELDGELREIKDQVTASGSFANVEISHKTMLLYRERAAEILEDIFEETGDISSYFSIGDANG